MRLSWLLLAAVFAIGCGSTTEQNIAEGSSIRAVDRPAPGAHKTESEAAFELRLEPSWDPCEEAPTPENLALCKEQREVERIFKADEERRKAQHEDEISPVDGTEARVVAELALREDAAAELVAWRGRNGKTCILARIAPAHDRGLSARRVGPCVRFMPCTELCLTVLTTNDMQGVLGGTVPQDADVLRLLGPEGRKRDYELSGPVIAGSELRVFLADLADEDWWAAELIRGDETLARDDTIGSYLRALRCTNEPEFTNCYEATPRPPDPIPPDAEEDKPEPTCERRFDDTDSGFQNCGEEGAEEAEA